MCQTVDTECAVLHHSRHLKSLIIREEILKFFTKPQKKFNKESHELARKLLDNTNTERRLKAYKCQI